MKAEKAKYSWHYYVMATGALGAMLAATLGSIGGIAAGLALAVVSHSALPFKTMTRFAFMVIFTGLYIFSFPDPSVVRDLMANQHTRPAVVAEPVVADITEEVSVPAKNTDTTSAENIPQ